MFLKKLDIISPNICLYYNNKKRHSSIFGGLLSLIFILNLLGLLIQHSIFNDLPNKHSLHVYRNYDINITSEYFNEDESGIFHFFYLYNDNNLEYEELIKYKQLKNGALHIYMINLFNTFEYNSSNLNNYDHWVYESCNNYALEEDIKYDYSFSFCIRHYYNSLDKKYYSINDVSNFKYPFFKQSYFISENSFFTVFIEKCSNNSLINNILGKSHSEEKINDFLNIFNNIFISFVDNKIQMSDEKNPIKNYSHQIHNDLKNNQEFFSFHEMEFSRFNYQENGVFFKKIEINSFMLEDDKISKIYNNINNKVLAAYSFHFKNYFNEFRKQEHKVFIIFRIISSNVIFVYFIFYCINLFFNEITQTKDFLSFINDNNDTLIQKHINYDKNKIFSFKSNLNSNESNENNNIQFSTLRSSYLGNIKTNANFSNMSNIYYRDNNSKLNKKLEIIDLREKEENNYSKKSENIFFINNGTFMDGNGENKNKLNLNIFEKKKSMRSNHKKNETNVFEKNNKIYSYRKIKKETNIDISNNNKYIFRNLKEKNSENNSNKNYDTLDNDSKQKIMNNSSISLLYFIYNHNNINIFNNSNIFQKNEFNPFKNDKKFSIYFPANLYSHNNLNAFNKNKVNDIDNKKYSVSTKNNIKNFRKNRFNISLIKPNTKSYEKDKKNKTPNLERLNHNKRRKSLSNEIIDDNNSQISLARKLRDNFRKNSHLNKLKGNKLSKDKIKQEHEGYTKKKKVDQNSLNVLHTPKNMAKRSFNFEKGKIFTIKNFWKYLCLCQKSNKNHIRLITNFRKRLLSEEYLYIAHLSLNIFKRKLGLKLFLDKKDLMEELYYDY